MAKEMKQQMRELTDRLEQGVKNVFESGQYEQYLRTMSQFHQYSFRNSMLIWLQRPDATRVAGFTTWKNTFGRSVNKGEKGIRILAPSPYKRRVEETHDQQGNPLRDENGNPTSKIKEITVPAFKPVPVFDVSQTSGRELPSLSSELTGNVDNYDLLFESLKKVSPYPIVFEEIEGGAEGYCDFKNQRIVLNVGKPQAQNVAVAFHELAHATFHNPDLPAELQKDRQTEEIEAESISFVVGSHYGILTNASSFGYIAGWSQDKELSKLQESLDTIQKAAAKLINDIDGQIQVLTQQRAAEQEQSSHSDQLTLYQNNSTPKATMQIDAPFVPIISVLQTVDNPEQVGLLKYQVEESGQVYSIDGDEDGCFPVNTVDLDTGEMTVVGFDHLRGFTFEANAFSKCLFENDAANIGTKNLTFPEHPGKWQIVDKIVLRDDTYFAVAQQGDLIPNRQYMIVDQHGELFIDQAFKDMEQWGHRDFVDSVSSKLAEQEAVRINSQSVTVSIESVTIGTAPKRPGKPSIGDKLEKAKQSLSNNTALNKPTQHVVCAGMER